MTFRLKIRNVTCPCGCAFETSHAFKKYCSSTCKNKFKPIKSDHVKKEQESRCRKLIQSSAWRSFRDGLKHNITVDYLVDLWDEQEGRCALTGRLLDIRKADQGSGKPWPSAPSLDRIVPEEGYTQGNVRFVCYHVNVALHSYGEDVLISLCKDILEYNEGSAT